jgi:hypothetical protein
MSEAETGLTPHIKVIKKDYKRLRVRLDAANDSMLERADNEDVLRQTAAALDYAMKLQINVANIYRSLRGIRPLVVGTIEGLMRGDTSPQTTMDQFSADENTAERIENESRGDVANVLQYREFLRGSVDEPPVIPEPEEEKDPWTSSDEDMLVPDTPPTPRVIPKKVRK